MTKQEILEVIRQTAKENGGKPLGQGRFEKVAGINSYEWGKYWARFGDAQKEAGFIPNQLQIAYADDFLLKKLIELIRKLQKFPTFREIAVEKNHDSELPDKKTFARFGTKEKLAHRVLEYCKAEGSYDDIVEVCRLVITPSGSKEAKGLEINPPLAEVYLFKSGRYYKIGKTKDTVRRGSELRIQLPETCNLIHSIRTDDPSGIEAYWHKRFDAQRKQGEWFDLSATDIKAFKRWKKIA